MPPHPHLSAVPPSPSYPSICSPTPPLPLLRSPSVYQLDILETPAAAAVAANPDTAPLYKLAAAVLAGDVAGGCRCRCR